MSHHLDTTYQKRTLFDKMSLNLNSKLDQFYNFFLFAFVCCQSTTQKTNKKIYV